MERGRDGWKRGEEGEWKRIGDGEKEKAEKSGGKRNERE